MKKLLALFLYSVMIISTLIACGNKEGGASSLKPKKMVVGFGAPDGHFE